MAAQEKRRLFVNILVEEPKTKVSEQETSHNQKIQHQAAKVIPAVDPAKQANAVRATEDCYESCLDLSALFLGRG
jgi:hypothetical protein